MLGVRCAQHVVRIDLPPEWRAPTLIAFAAAVSGGFTITVAIGAQHTGSARQRSSPAPTHPTWFSDTSALQVNDAAARLAARPGVGVDQVTIVGEHVPPARSRNGDFADAIARPVPTGHQTWLDPPTPVLLVDVAPDAALSDLGALAAGERVTAAQQQRAPGLSGQPRTHRRDRALLLVETAVRLRVGLAIRRTVWDRMVTNAHGVPGLSGCSRRGPVDRGYGGRLRRCRGGGRRLARRPAHDQDAPSRTNRLTTVRRPARHREDWLARTAAGERHARREGVRDVRDPGGTMDPQAKKVSLRAINYGLCVLTAPDRNEIGAGA